jgi:hypothetical protein
MTSGHVLLVGDDLCARANVLEHVGYLVACCACEADALRKTLVHSVDAVLFQCMPEPPSPALLSTCSALTHAPIVLFADSNSAFNSSDFELVVPNLRNPREWSGLPANRNAGHEPSSLTNRNQKSDACIESCLKVHFVHQALSRNYRVPPPHA